MTVLTVRARILAYCTAILGGTTPSGNKHKWACLRFLRDLEREGTEKFPWVFDPLGGNGHGPAQQYLNWMGLFKHSKGPLAGTPKIPCEYEVFVYGQLYGWVHMVTGKRRFRRSYEQIGRKNAKSQDKAIQALYEMSEFGESMAEVYVAATKKEQTRHVWGEAAWLYKNSILADKFTCKFDQELQQTAIRHKKSNSFFCRLSKDDKKSGDGANPHFLIIDEYHLHETTEYYDLGSSGMKTREQPLLSIITTAGFELNRPCYRIEYAYVSKILDPDNPIENDRYFVMICELDTSDGEALRPDGTKIAAGEVIDDVKDRGCWVKANPVIGTSEVSIESIEIDVMEAEDKPEKRRDLLTKTFNVWVNQRTAGYINMAKWARCAASADRPFPDVRGLRVIPGLDLSSTIDLTSLSIDIPLADGVNAVLSHSFMPEEKLAEKRKTDKVDFDMWVHEKWITATPGAQVDYHLVLEYIETIFEQYEWPKGEVCFDRALGTWMGQELDLLDFTAIDVPQTFGSLSSPIKDFRAKVLDGKIIHDNNPVLTWAMGNAIVRTGPSGNLLLDKAKAAQRFDPVAALITAHFRAMLLPEETGGRVFFA